MQTFLPYPDFRESATCLDDKRLGCQRIEVAGILKTLLYGGRYINHPICQMWKGYEGKLLQYGLICCEEWINRSFKDNTTDTLVKLHRKYSYSFDRPWWLGDERLHSSHRSALLKKKPDFYNKFEWADEPTINYWWPTKIEAVAQQKLQLELAYA